MEKLFIPIPAVEVKLCFVNFSSVLLLLESMITINVFEVKNCKFNLKLSIFYLKQNDVLHVL